MNLAERVKQKLAQLVSLTLKEAASQKDAMVFWDLSFLDAMCAHVWVSKGLARLGKRTQAVVCVGVAHTGVIANPLLAVAYFEQRLT